MAPLKRWIVLLFIGFIFLLVICAVYRYGAPSATYSPLEPLSESRAHKPAQPPYQNQSDNETQPVDRKSTPVPPPEGRTDNETQRNTTEAMYRRLVVLTAFSSNHYREALDMIGSMQTYLPHSKIIVYDIGLAPEEKGNVSKFCNVEFRSFNFSRYPPHVKMDLSNYSWKPLITQELVDQGYDVILYGDTSLRITRSITQALESVLDFPFLDMKCDCFHSIISLTHEKMIEYFQFPPSRQYMAHWATVQSGGWLLLVNDMTREKLIAPWTDCALHVECMAPKGATTSNCNFALNAHNDGTYIGCHRYDQSALNIILAKYFGLDIWNKVVREEVTDPMVTVIRQYKNAEGFYPVKHHPHCND